MNKTILIIGNGSISRGIKYYVPESIIIKRPEYDIRDELNVPEIDPGVAVICAAITGFGMCEKYPVWSKGINVTSTFNAAQKLHSAGWNVIMLSSSAAVNPTTEYGRQKNELESMWEFGPILRLPKVLSPDVAVIESWIRLLNLSQPVRAFSHGIIQPVPRKSVADSIKILSSIKNGTYEITGPICTWHHVAQEIARVLDKDVNLVQEQDDSTLYDVMDNRKMLKLGWHQYSLKEMTKFIIDEWSKGI